MTLLLFTALGCTPQPEPSEAPATPVVMTLSVPVDYAVRRLVPSGVTVELVPPPDADPGHWRPSADAVASLQEADLIVANGAGYEAWTSTANLPAARLLDSSAGIELLAREAKTHQHGREGAHSHGEVDAHTWMNPTSYATQVQNISNGLGGLAGVDAAAVSAAADRLVGELKALDEAQAARLDALEGVELATSHAAFGYLGRRHGLVLTDFDLDPEAGPTEEQRAALAAWAQDRAPAVLWWEAAPSTAAAAAVPEGVTQIVVDPLEQGTAGAYDYLAQSRANDTAYAETVALFAPSEAPAEPAGTPEER